MATFKVTCCQGGKGRKPSIGRPGAVKPTGQTAASRAAVKKATARAERLVKQGKVAKAKPPKGCNCAKQAAQEAVKQARQMARHDAQASH